MKRGALRELLGQMRDRRFWRRMSRRATEPVIGAEDLDALKDPYYARIANRYGTAQILLFVLLFFFVIGKSSKPSPLL